MTRQGYKQYTIPDALHDEILRFVQNRDARLSSEPTGADLLRSLYRIAKRSPSSVSSPGEAGNSSTVQSADQEPVRDRPVHQERQEPTERQKLEQTLLAQKITLERQKQRTEWLKAVRQGKIQPLPRTPVVSSQPVGFLCKLHQTVHQDGPCQEITEIAKELQISVEQAGKGGF